MELLTGTVTITDVDEFLERLEAAAADTSATVQAFDGRYVAGRRHMAVAVRSANRAIANDEAIADDRAVELCCYAAGRRQIGDALEMGVTPGTGPVVVLVDTGDELAARDRIEAEIPELAPVDECTTGDPEVLSSFFGIGSEERAATRQSLEALVCERVALLAVEK